MNCQEFGLTTADVQARVTAFRITEQDKALLRQLGPIIKPKMGFIVDKFYEHVLSMPGTAAIVSGAGSSIEALKKTNPDYFAAIFEARFDDKYFDSRLKVGMIHAKIGLTADFFFGAMTTYADLINKIVLKKLWYSPAKAVAIITSLQKAFTLDQELIIESYIQYGFLESIEQVSTQSTAICASLSESTAHLRSAASDSGQASSEVASASERVATSATVQAESALKVQDAITILGNRGEELQSNLNAQAEAVETAQEAISGIQEVGTTINTLAATWESIKTRVSSMDQLKATVNTASKEVAELQRHSSEIGTIVSTISEIADQTNLLALNAAIEAARAGEHGRGFAVVSEEVRKLAEQSAQAANEIRDLIGSVMGASQKAGEAMSKTLGDVENALEVAVEATTSLQKISDAAGSIDTHNAKIEQSMSAVHAATTQGQDALISVGEQIGEAIRGIQEVAEIAQDNSAAAEQMCAAAEELTAQVQVLLANATEVEHESGNLNALVEQTSEAVSKGSRKKSTKTNLKVAA